GGRVSAGVGGGQHDRGCPQGVPAVAGYWGYFRVSLVDADVPASSTRGAEDRAEPVGDGGTGPVGVDAADRGRCRCGLPGGVSGGGAGGGVATGGGPGQSGRPVGAGDGGRVRRCG